MGAHSQGVGILSATGSATCLAAPGAAYRYHIRKIILTGKISTTGIVSISDGTTTIVSYIPAYGHPGTLDFGEPGFKCALNGAITLTLATDNIPVTAVVIADKMGG